MMGSGGKRRALFLDRDGVINEEVGYLSRSADVRFVPGIFSLCRAAQRHGYIIVVVTNQSGIARGLYTELEFGNLMRWMRGQFMNEHVRLDGVYHCPYHPEYGVGVYRRDHEDRKPSPGMLLRAARDLGIELGASAMVGDRCSDVAAANAAGLRNVFLLTSTEMGLCPGTYSSIQHLSEAEAWIAAATQTL